MDQTTKWILLIAVVTAFVVGGLAGFLVGGNQSYDETQVEMYKNRQIAGVSSSQSGSQATGDGDSIVDQQWRLYESGIRPAHTFPLRTRGKPYAMTVTEIQPSEKLPFELGLTPPKQPIAWYEARNYLNQEVSVVGKVVATHHTGKVVYLNFDKDWRGKFHLVLYRSAWEAIAEKQGEAAEKFYLNKTIRIQGAIRSKGGAPQIIVRSASRIELVDPVESGEISG